MKATVSLGSNIRPRSQYLERAMTALSNLPRTWPLDASDVIETEPVDVPYAYRNLKFLNQVAFFETALEVHEFARAIHAIEDSLGRVRSVKNGPRTIDIDLIAFGDLTLNEPGLTLPHPRAAARDFVMRPLRALRRRELRARYAMYVDEYRSPDGTLPEMMQLKLTHTMAVEGNARLIAAGEGFGDAERHAALAAALLHDTGRYEQLKLYNTFRDADSVDHAVFSHRIVSEKGWLGDWGAAESAPVLAAVLYHNRRDLPEGLDALTLAASQAVRDADKLDIFRVLESQVETCTPYQLQTGVAACTACTPYQLQTGVAACTPYQLQTGVAACTPYQPPDWRHDSRAFWNLQTGVPPNPEVVRAIRERRPVDYQNIRSLADFVLIQVGWMLSGLYYATTRKLCAERGHLEFRRRFLREIGGGDEAERLCDLCASCEIFSEKNGIMSPL